MKIVTVKDFEDYSSFFCGKRGNRWAELIMKVFAIERVNELYNRSSFCTGPQFASCLLNDLGVNYRIGNAERLKYLPEGAFITVSNHPYGGLDGIILIDLFGGIRSDYKFMVNKLISMVKTMKDNFITVTPSGNKKNGISGASINGIRETMAHLNEGHPVGFFPSGAVSDFSLRELKIRDRKWQDSILRLIQKAKVPVLPVRFFDNNSAFFYFLGLINWMVRSFRLPSELFNKKKQNPRIGIGNLISVEEQQKYSDIRLFGEFLRRKVYEMSLPDSFFPRNMLEISSGSNGKQAAC
jgi:putative hemolysin